MRISATAATIGRAACRGRRKANALTVPGPSIALTGRAAHELRNPLDGLSLQLRLTRMAAETGDALETVDVVGSTVALSFGVSGFVDNLFFLRFVESGGRVKRLLSITKMRDSDYDPGLHEMHIGASGIRIAGLYSLDGDVIPTAHPMSSEGQ
jgi:KaiC/GvpD/RAD55 family RecA-like ATPase